MIKKLLLLFIAVFMLSLSAVAYAQTELTEKTPTASESANASSAATLLEPEVKDLKDKIATKVAELRKKSQKAIVGNIIELKEGSIKVESVEGVQYEVKTDASLTKTYQIGTGYKEIKTSDLKKDDYIIVTGPVLDQSVEANVIYRDERYIVVSGKLTEVDKTDFFLKVATTSKENYTIDVEKGTVQQMLNIKTLLQEKTTFSKIKEGDTIHVAAKKDPKVKEEGRFSGIRFLIIPQEYFQK